jgi:hypothetical protein
MWQNKECVLQSMENSILLETKVRAIFRTYVSVHFLDKHFTVILRYALKTNAHQI